jgi:Family of unknown function (DUF5906)
MTDTLDDLLGGDGPVRPSTVEEYVRELDAIARNTEQSINDAAARMQEESDAAEGTAFPQIFAHEDELNARFAYIEESDKYLDLKTGLFRDIRAMRNSLSASKVERDRDNPQMEGGAPNRMRLMELFPIWAASPRRKTVAKYDFAPAHSYPFFSTEDGTPCANSCKPSPYANQPVIPANVAMPHVKMFVDHIKFLCTTPFAAKIQLQWFCHLVQKPEEQVNWIPFHTTPHDGVGRGWIAKLLQRMFPGQVICKGTFEQIYVQKFNRERLFARVLFAEEVSEKFSNKENFHQFITEEYVSVEPKFGDVFRIKNSAHKIGATNKAGAISVEANDRRVFVIQNPLKPHPEGKSYYDNLYGALGNPEFLISIYQFLAQTSIVTFDASGRAQPSAGTKEMHERSLPAYAAEAVAICTAWPSRAIRAATLKNLILEAMDDPKFTLSPDQVRFISSITRAKVYNGKIRFPIEGGSLGNTEAVYILPGGEALHDMRIPDVRKEVLKGEDAYRKIMAAELAQAEEEIKSEGGK